MNGYGRKMWGEKEEEWKGKEKENERSGEKRA